MLLLACFLSLGLCRRRRSMKELVNSASRILEMNSAREAAAAYSNQLFAADSGLNEDIGNFEAADCHCYPCEASPDDLKGQEMTSLSETMKSQQAKLARLTNVAAQISAKEKKAATKNKKPRRQSRRQAFRQDDELLDDGLEDEEIM